MLGNVVSKRLLTDAFDNIACQGRPIVGISRQLSRWPDTLGQMPCQVGTQRQQFVRPAGKEKGPVFKTGAMTHQMFERDRYGIGRRKLEVEIVINVRVKIELKKGDARQQVVADVISCLSKQDDRLVSIMCDVATEKCDVSRERDEDTPAIEETLRQLRQQPAQQNKI